MKPLKIKCRYCGTIIWSSYPKEFVSCKCGKIGIDECEFYCRKIGNAGDYEEVK